MQTAYQLPNKYVVFALLLILTGLFLNMGLHPLYHEEPRRAMIAWEMLQHHQWFTPTVTGEYYYKKPAAYNWLIAFSYSIFGINEFSTRFFSQLAFIGLAVLGFAVGRKYINKSFGIWNALLMLSCVDIVFYFSVTGGEIDLVFACIIAWMAYLLFHFYEKQQFLLMFTVSYGLAAIGTLTKALPAIAFIGFSVLALLIYKKDIKRLFSAAHVAGILVYFLITGAYFYIHIEQNPFGVEGYIKDMWKDSSQRTVLENGTNKLIIHLISFPFEMIKNILPAGLLIVFALRKDFFMKIKLNPFAKYAFYFLLANLPLYYISPGARSRYTYMFFPFLIFILTYFYFEVEGKKDLWEKVFKIVANVLCILVPIAAIALIFIPQGDFIEGLWWQLSIVAGIGGLIAFWHYTKKFHFMLTFVMLIALARIGFDLTVLPYKAAYSSQKEDKDKAYNLSQITKEKSVKLYKETQLSLTTLYYFQIYNNRILHVSEDAEPGDLVIFDVEYANEFDFEEQFRFKFRENERILGKIK